MNFYIIIYRLNSDSRNHKRYWEDFAESRDSAISALSEYCQKNFFDGDLFSLGITILRLDEYLSIFK